MRQISLNVNGKRVDGAIEPRTHLADFLRETHNLTGTHLGCEHGVCGACTLLVDGVPIRSCIALAAAVDGTEVTTIEGLNDDEVAGELRAAFTREHALQCGYCTPGMLISARDLVMRSPEADEREIRVAMSGNLCRCTGYVGIIRAIQSVIAERRARGIGPLPGAGRTLLGPAGSGYGSAERGDAVSRRKSVAADSDVVRTSGRRKASDTDWVPQVSFEQAFQVAHPRQQVWDIFGRVEDVAACLPGAKILRQQSPDHVEGQFRVKIGPIAAEFNGEAEIERDETSFSGRIVGSGSDGRSQSSTRGMIRYRLLPADEGKSTRVELSVGYTLTGPLAQLGRSGIVQDLAARLTSIFAQNLEARLSGKTGATDTQPDAGLPVATLVVSVIAARIKALFSKLTGRD
jgi:carbon-monoxide dehydrogenase small subunit